jgi:hypothetical protein
MVSLKVITMAYKADLPLTYKATIRSDMSENDIYEALRTACNVGNYHIILMDPKYNDQKVRLSYPHLKEGKVYTLGTGMQRMWGVGTQSFGSQSAIKNVADIRMHWNLDATADVLPSDMAPREEAKWSHTFIFELLQLAVHTQQKHQYAMALLQAQLQARGATQVTTIHCRGALAVAQQQEDEVDTATFVGGLREAAEQALEEEGEDDAAVGWDYEQDGKFYVGMH